MAIGDRNEHAQPAQTVHYQHVDYLSPPIPPAQPKGLKSSWRDTKALARHGKVQQLNRTFGFIPAIAFSSLLLSCWEAEAVTIKAGFENGGPVALIYGLILAFAGTMTLCLSLAEMASIAPVSGAQYHYVAMLTRSTDSHLLSWVAGWLTVFAWQANIASVGYLTATQIQALVIFNNDSYAQERWHGSLIFWAVVIVGTSINVFGIKILPHLETLFGVLHLCVLVTVLVPLVYLSPQRPASEVFTDFENNSGWDNNVVSWCLGLLTVTYPLIGFEGVSHISEEIENASVIVPRSMVYALLLNGVLAFGFIIGLVFSASDLKAALNSPTQSPILHLLHDALQMKAITSGVFSLLIFVVFCVEMGMIASTSRLTWAFARDNGLPFSKTFAYVNPRFRIPINAILLNVGVAMILNLLNIASSTAFSAVISLTVLSLYVSYIIPIIIMVIRRLRKDKVHFGPFKLGAFGLPINIIGLLWAFFTVGFVILPRQMPVTSDNMNYAPVMFGAAIIVILLLWFLYGHRVFHGPIDEIGDKDIRMVDEG